MKKTLIISGGSGGIGRDLAEHYANFYNVIALGRRDAQINGVEYFKVNLENLSEVNQFMLKLRRNKVEPYGIILNAACLTSRHALLLSDNEIREMLETNYWSSINLLRKFAKLVRNAACSRAVFVSSMAVSLNPIGDSVYASTKIGVEKFIEIFSKEVASYNMTINTVSVSSYPSPMLSQLPRKKIDEVVSGLTIPRHAQLSDIVNVIDFYLNEKSDFITAQKVNLAGVT